MPSDVVIKVENLSKEYTIRHQPGGSTNGLRHVLQAAVMTPFRAVGRKSAKAGIKTGNGAALDVGKFPDPRRSLPAREVFWALKDVSLEVRRGEAVGIIGRNGAGKSTLLKILSRITEPTRGRIGINGRVASLLEVGTGFHPELTGRENIFLNGAILGMTRQEVRRKFDEIVDFARVEKFLDTPVKYYSSGMYVRLAFAVAAHLEPEVLVVDEVLAVGDADFQKKCLGKMGEVAKKGGRTVLFVSHNMQAVNSLCSRAISLDAGRIVKSGRVTEVIDDYLATLLEDATNAGEQTWDEMDRAPGNEKIRLRRIAVIPEGERPSCVIDMVTPFRVEVDYWNLVPDTEITLGLGFSALDGSPVFQSESTREPYWNGKPFPKALFRSVCFVPGHLLNEGSFSIQLFFVADGRSQLWLCRDAITISITNTQVETISRSGRFEGYFHPLLSWRTELLGSSRRSNGSST
jgi:lipopolysaccharide transport system ATP-binding protein